MDTIIKKTALNPSIVKGERYFLDIETTGLCKQSDIIFCIGIMFVEKSNLTSYQWIINTPDEEALLLKTFLDFVKGFKSVITYSGKQFDIPFLIARLNALDLPTIDLEAIPHIDLKRFSILKAFNKEKALNRRALEESLGFKREIEINGREIIKVYKLYADSKRSSYQLLLLHHNREELISAYFFYEFYYLFNQLTFNKLEVLNITDLESHIRITTSFEFVTHGDFAYNNNLFISWENLTNSIEIRIIPQLLTLKKFLTPAKDYVYIPSQNQIMHKSVSQFIPKELKQKISSSQCFLTKKGSYLQLPSNHLLDLPIWYDDEKNSFVEYKSITTPEQFWLYIKLFIIPRIL